MFVYSSEDVGLMIRAARKKAGLTQQELADECGCGSRFISDLEKGKATVELGLAIRVINMLSMDLAVVERKMS